MWFACALANNIIVCVLCLTPSFLYCNVLSFLMKCVMVVVVVVSVMPPKTLK